MGWKNCFSLAMILVATVFMAGCLSTNGMKSESEDRTLTICPEIRPQICTRDYRPVCAELKEGSFKGFPNGCTACADADVVGYRDGECTEGK